MIGFNSLKANFDATDWAWHDIQDRCEFNVARVDTAASLSSIDVSSLISTDAKYAGGVLAPNGCIYFIPYTANRVMKLDPETGTAELIGDTVNAANAGYATMKYWGGVLGPDGIIYCIPYYAKYVMKIDPTTNTVDFMSTDIKDSTYANTTTMMWRGGVLAPNGIIYCIPYNAGYILKIDTVNQTVSTMTDYTGSKINVKDTCGTTSSCYAGGVLGPDGKIYCIPYNADYVGIIDPIAETFTLDDVELTTSNAGYTSLKYIGGVLGTDGCIYTIPYGAKNFLKIDTSKETGKTGYVTTSFSTAGTKYSGGVLAPNGNLYCIPWGHDYVYVQKTKNGTLSKTFQSWDTAAERWNGGVLAPNGKIYCAPYDSDEVLIISPAPTTNTNFGLATLLSPYLNKF